MLPFWTFVGDMPQIFHRSANTIARVSIFGALFFVAGLLYLAYQIDRSPWVTQVNVAREQPIQFSHERHVAGNGIDCRYCHTTVETSGFAGIPPTKTCMNCHSQIFANAPFLEPVRESFRTDKPIAWTRVHDLPDFAYFDHSIHVAKGVGCSTCHGPVDKMPLMRKQNSLQMEWCLDCHRHPERYVRPREEVFNMSYVAPANQLELGPEARRRKSHPEDDRLQRMSPMKPFDSAQDSLQRAEFWRTLAEKNGANLDELVGDEFASRLPEAFDPVERRAFLKLMGASLALAGMAGCTRQPPEQILPYVRQPEDIVPGQAALLRNRDDARRPRDRPSRRKPRRTADEDRREPDRIRRASARPMPSRRPHCSISTIPIACRRSRTWARSSRGPRSSARCAP